MAGKSERENAGPDTQASDTPGLLYRVPAIPSMMAPGNPGTAIALTVFGLLMVVTMAVGWTRGRPARVDSFVWVPIYLLGMWLMVEKKHDWSPSASRWLTAASIAVTALVGAMCLYALYKWQWLDGGVLFPVLSGLYFVLGAGLCVRRVVGRER
jgi:hypothetical protein